MLDSLKKKIRNFQINSKLSKILVYGSYTIDSEGFVNSIGSIAIKLGKGKSIPVKFGKVSGDFDCYNGVLESLENSPYYVGGNFNCSRNELRTLKGSPKFVGGYFECSFNHLESLEGCPDTIIGHFGLDMNELKSLEPFPKKVGGNVLLSDNLFGNDISSLKPCDIQGYIVVGKRGTLYEKIIPNEDIVENFRLDKIKEMKDSLEESLAKKSFHTKALKV